jgi:hypothetical protein
MNHFFSSSLMCNFNLHELVHCLFLFVSLATNSLEISIVFFSQIANFIVHYLYEQLKQIYIKK